MSGKKATAGILGATALIMGGVDVAVLDETPIERVETVADERVEAKQIGNVIEATFPWKDQEGIKVKYDMGEPTLEERVTDKRKKKVITETVTSFDGGFKVDILLTEKPDTNRFCYTVDGAENYDFFYQSPLTLEEIEEGASRPPEIEGSYAVYHKTLKNHVIGQENYATGKVMHIPRPQVWEIGNEDATIRWADLSYSDGVLCVNVPQDFIDNANYKNGVRIDPTFGYTSIGGTEFEPSADNFYIANVSTSSPSSFNVAVASVSFYGRKETNDRGSLAAIYQFGVSSTTADLLSPTSTELTINSTTAQWWTNTFTGPTITAGSGALPTVNLDWVSATDNIHIYRDAASAGDTKFQATTYPAFSNPATLSNSSNIYSIYANYSLSNTGGSHQQVDTFLSSSNWVAPVGVSSTTVEAWGAGGGGTFGSGSGGGGAYARSSGVSVSAGSAYAVVVGTSGAGSVGGTSTFNGTTVVAQGGRNGTTGLGGSASASTGDVKYSGGNGFASTTSAGGGGGAGDSATGTDNGGVSFRVRGGDNNGGFGAQASPISNDVAGTPAGGGATSNSTSLAGARGEVRITYMTSAPENAASVASRSWGRSTTSVTSLVMNMPSGIVAGDLLIAIVTNDGSATTSIDGWTIMGTGVSGSAIRSTVFYKVATGGETATITPSSSEGIVYVAYRISNGGIPGGTSSNGTLANPNPPLHTASSSATYLWITTAGQDNSFVGSYIFGGCPTQYTSCLFQSGYGAGGAVHMVGADKFAIGQTDDPSSFSMPTPSTDGWVAWTIAVPYSVSSGGGATSTDDGIIWF